MGGNFNVQRAQKRHAAGLRTYGLVCLGATIAMMTNEYFAIKYNQKGCSSTIQLNFNKWEDQDKLLDFLIELKANCEVLMES